MLNNPLTIISDFTTPNLNDAVKQKPGTVTTDNYMKRFDFLEGIYSSPGMFFSIPQLIFEKIKNIILAMITACFTLYLLYHFSAQLAEFAADMTEGVALSNVAINPQLIFKAGMAAIGAAGKAMDASKASGGGENDSIASKTDGSDQMAARKGGQDMVAGSSGGGDNVSASSAPALDNPVDDGGPAPVEPSSSIARPALDSSVDDSAPRSAEPSSSRASSERPDDSRAGEQEDHSLQMGESGYVKQELRNVRVRRENSSLGMREKSSNSVGGSPKVSSSAPKALAKDKPKKASQPEAAGEGDPNE